VQRVVAQSYAGWPFARTDGAVKSEEDALDPDPPDALRATLDAIRHVERAVTAIDWGEGVVLRYGGFYGPGTNLSSDPRAEMAEVVRKRKFPLVGDGAGIWSFIHIDDAAAATVAAIEHGATGIYQVVDDEPAPVRDWLPTLAKTLGAKPPRHLPRWLGRLAAGEAATVMMTEVRGASNAKAKRELDWAPVYSSWRTGFAEGLG
jgi:nucleoside-diphosphate-sugar epimerase